MTPLIIILSVLALVCFICFLPVSAKIVYDDDFAFSLRVAGIKVYDSKKEEKKPKKPKEPVDKKPKKPKKEVLKGLNFKKLTKKYGFTGAVKRFMDLASGIFTHIKKFLRHIKFRKTKLKAVVSAENAADTAIYYGEVCAAVYPVLALLESLADVDFKKIDVSADFAENKPCFKFETVISTNVLYLILAFFGAYSEYKKFLDEEEENERKQD